MVANYRQGSGILMAVSGYIFAVTKKASLNNNYIDRVKHYTNPFFQVTEHKTAEKGPAMIALSPEIYRMVKNCIQWCKQIPGFDDDKDKICLSLGRKTMEHLCQWPAHMSTN